ncbi:MAG TPA: hydrolase [Candidatus Methanoperedens sp.]|nr:hydrolase [Candidatus Methanoperedens sp.]
MTGSGRFQLDRDETVLLVVDIQERLAAVMGEREKVVANAGHLIAAAQLLGVPVLHTEQYPKGLGPTVPELRGPLAPAAPVEKMTFDCCGEPTFTPAFEQAGRSTVVVCGMETHICVLQTVLGLLAQGLVVHVAADAVCSRSPENARVALELMRDAGAVVTCTETVMFQLLVRAGTPEFKAIQARIR